MKGVPWMTAEQAAIHLGFTKADGSANGTAFRKWLSRQPSHQPKRHYLGRRLRFRQVDLDACVEPMAEARAPRLHVVRGGR